MADPAGDTGILLRSRDDDAPDKPAITLDACPEGKTNADAVRLETGDDARAATLSQNLSPDGVSRLTEDR